MNNILLFLISVIGMLFFFIAPFKRVIASKRADEVASRARTMERNLHECDKYASGIKESEVKSAGSSKSGKNYYSSLNPKFIECLHNAVYNPTAKAEPTEQ